MRANTKKLAYLLFIIYPNIIWPLTDEKSDMFEAILFYKTESHVVQADLQLDM